MNHTSLPESSSVPPSIAELAERVNALLWDSENTSLKDGLLAASKYRLDGIKEMEQGNLEAA